MQLRSLQSRIVILFLSLILAIQLSVFFVIRNSIEINARDSVAGKLEVGEHVLSNVLEQNAKNLSQGASILAADYGFRQAIGTNEVDTITSALSNHRKRLNAELGMFFNRAGEQKGVDSDTALDINIQEVTKLIESAQQNGSASGIALFGGQPFQLVVVPVKAPITIGWIVMGFVLDDDLAKQLSVMSLLQVSILAAPPHQSWSLVATTLSKPVGAELLAGLTGKRSETVMQHSSEVEIAGTDNGIRFVPILDKDNQSVVVVLQQSISEVVAPYRRLQFRLLLISLLSVGVFFSGSIFTARRITRPILDLLETAKNLARGEYHRPVDTRHNDEIGDLARALDIMRTSISERELALRESEERFHLMVDAVQDYAILMLDLEGRVTTWNIAAERLIGYCADEIIGKHFSRFYTNEDIVKGWPESVLKTVLAAGKFQEEGLRVHKDGSIFWANVQITTILDDAGSPRGFATVTRDITENKQHQHDLQLAATIYKAIGEAVVVIDRDNHILAINPKFTELSGYSEADVVGQPTQMICSKAARAQFDEIISTALDKTGHWQGDIWCCSKDGKACHKWLVINTIYDDLGIAQLRVAMFSEVTEQKMTEQSIWKQANYDPLTELPNRRMFMDRLELESKKADRANLQMALIFVDLDHFKEVNDTLGHDAGDMLLKEATRRLVGSVREVDMVARLGGDEFTIIVGELEDRTDVERIAQEILHKLALPFQLKGKVAHVSASIGVTFYPADANNTEQLLKNADRAMYESKSLGRNCSSYFRKSLRMKIK